MENHTDSEGPGAYDPDNSYVWYCWTLRIRHIVASRPTCFAYLDAVLFLATNMRKKTRVAAGKTEKENAVQCAENVCEAVPVAAASASAGRAGPGANDPSAIFNSNTELHAGLQD